MIPWSSGKSLFSSAAFLLQMHTHQKSCSQNGETHKNISHEPRRKFQPSFAEACVESAGSGPALAKGGGFVKSSALMLTSD